MVSPPRHPAKIPAIISKAIREVENFVWFIGLGREKGGNKDLTGINKIWKKNAMSFLVRAPGLEPKSGITEPFLLLREMSFRCLEDIRRGRTGTARQLLTMLAGVEQ
jgi:hypothetical protein